MYFDVFHLVLSINFFPDPLFICILLIMFFSEFMVVYDDSGHLARILQGVPQKPEPD